METKKKLDRIYLYIKKLYGEDIADQVFHKDIKVSTPAISKLLYKEKDEKLKAMIEQI